LRFGWQKDFGASRSRGAREKWFSLVPRAAGAGQAGIVESILSELSPLCRASAPVRCRLQLLLLLRQLRRFFLFRQLLPGGFSARLRRLCTLRFVYSFRCPDHCFSVNLLN